MMFALRRRESYKPRHSWASPVLTSCRRSAAELRLWIQKWRWYERNSLPWNRLLIHREFARRGWRCVILDGMPWWVPPAWRDPEQKPLQNHRITAGT